MKKFKGTKKILALLLSLSLITGMMPATAWNAFAAESSTLVDAAIFCSDVHGDTSPVTSVFSAIKSDDPTFDASAVGVVGDIATSEDKVTNAAKTALGDDELECVYSYGSHDRENGCTIDDVTGILYGDDNTEYYIYAISQEDMGSASNAATMAATFTSELEKLDTSKPMFIMSHMPLHDRRNDNNGAANWYSAISAAAEKMDITFFWGHNHTGEDSVDRAAYYVAKDGTETMSIESGSTVTPNFTYMNAGYIGKSASRGGVATTVKIYNDSMVFQDYNSSGKYKDATYSHNVTVAREFAANITLTDITVTAPTKTEYSVGETLDLSGMSVMATYSDDNTKEVTTGYTISDVDMTTAGTKTVTVTYEGKTANFEITVKAVEEIPADAVLTDLAVEGPETLCYFIDENDYLDIEGLVVKAHYALNDETYTKTLEWDTTAKENEQYVYSLEFGDLTTPGKKTVTVSFEGKEATFEVWTCVEGVTNDTLNIDVTFDTPSVMELDIAPSTMSAADLAKALDGALEDGYVAYDFSATYGDGYNALKGKATVTVPVTGLDNPAVYYVSDDGKTVERMLVTDKTDTTVTFTTTHFSTFVVGESTEIVVPDNETAPGTATSPTTTTKTVYVLKSGTPSGKVLIASSDKEGSANLVANDSGDLSNVSATVVDGDCDGDGDREYYIELTDDEATNTLWTVEDSYKFKNQGEYLRYSNSSLSVSQNSTTWSYSNNSLSYRSTSSGGRPGSSSGGTTYYIYYNDDRDNWTVRSSSSNVYFYVPTLVEVETTTTVSGTYSIEGQDVSVAVAKDSNTELSSELVFKPESGTVTTTDVSTTAKYEIVSIDANGNEVDGDPNKIISNIANGVVTFSGNYGKALVKVSHETEFGTVTDYITIEAKAPYYTIQLHEAEMTKVNITSFETGTIYYTYNSTTGEYKQATEYVEGTTYYVRPLITGPIALKGIEAGDTYSVWAVVKEHNSANPDGKDLGGLGDALSWYVSDTSIATIDTETGVITFTGNNYGTFNVTVEYTGADGKLITDTIIISATDSLYVVPGDGTNDFPEYPNEGAVRFDKNATAVGNFSETGIAKVELSMTGVPYTTNNAMDVVVMLDMTGSMSDTAMVAAEEAAVAFVAQIVKNTDGTYNKNRIAVYAFNSSTSSPFELVSLSTVGSDTELTAVNSAIRTASDKKASGGTPYDEALEKCQSVLSEAKTTNLPDGVGSAADYNRQQFCVFMSDGGPTSYEYITNYDAVKNGTATEYTHSSASAQGGSNQSDSNFATIATYTHEYYSTQMKDDGVTMYSVLTGLSATDYPNCATILGNIASGNDKAYVVEEGNDTSAVSGALSNIAQSILEAATDVVVEDKIGNEYSMNFKLPTNVTSTDTEGLSEFYIQVVDYVLDATTHERTGSHTVKENFTFNVDGTFKSHTVDGIVCADCSHVTIDEDGVVTAISGTYFDYKSDSTGEYLTWEEDKVTSTELALQYFAHLDNSTDATSPEEAIPAGTYYTNEYATMTYSNYNGVEVQQEFPTPQMTWNGAQVSYVFYLVNEDGQPVNRAGRVVPFAEAVYVTDTYTHSVVWNDMEQAAGLEAKYLAEDIVPDVYALYDDDASYNIHVYEDETEVNLNNHFVIGGDVNDDYNTAETPAWSNANTTYVFNNKSDAVKYNAAGAYVADDGDNSPKENGQSYFCKSAIIEGATFETYEDNGVTMYKVTSLGEYGYQPVSGETQATVAQIEAIGGSTSGGTIIDGYIYYVDENEKVYTIVTKSDGREVEKGFDFSNTTVAFGVVWKPELKEDAVVVDYGLDVVVDVIANDAMNAELAGVTTDAPNAEINSGTYTSAKATTADVYIDTDNDKEGLNELKIGTATVENLKAVRFSLDKTNGMQFTDPAELYYEADVTYYDNNNELQRTNMYSSLTVIPATAVYYEDNFVDFKVYDKGESGWAENTDVTWDTAGTTKNATQATDRPGTNDPVMGPEYDAENVYGYDSAYDNMSTYSMGSARTLNVNADRYGTAEFEFWGTGFDVIALTSNNTGTITVQIDNVETKENVKTTIVDTYYGYTKDKDGNWIVDKDADNALYQVPVIESEIGTYGHYKVTIKAAYNTFFDHAKDGSYDMYIDAIRIYDPANDGADSDVIKNAYVRDGEGWPTYVEVRDLLIEQTTFDELDQAMSVNGIVLIDGVDATANVTDYKSFGPNNEVYLAENQSVAFDLDLPTDGAKVKDVQIGLKSADGNEVSYSVSGKTGTLKTATGMYYSILDKAYDTIVITNTSGGILSVTDVKITYESDPSAEAEAIAPLTMFRVSRATLASANEILTADPEVKSVTADKDVYAVGDTVTVTVKTNNATEYVTVNGEMVTEFTETDNARIWTFTKQTDVSGELTFAVAAYNSIEESTAVKYISVAVEEDVVEEPDNPVTPEEPDTPDTPATPAEPDTPDVPDTPATPEDPEADKPVVDEQEKPVVAAAKIISVKTDKKTYTQGDKVKVTVTTNSAATKVKVGTKTLKTFKTTKGNKTWTTTVKASKIGKLSINAVAYNKKGTATKKVTKKVTVKKFAPKKFNVTLNKSKVKKGAKYTVTVKTGTAVKYVKVNGKKITKYTYNKKTATKTFKVTYKATKVGKKTVKVVAYNKAGYASKAKTKTVTVKKK